MDMNFFDFLKYKLWLYDSLGLWFYRQHNKLNALGSLEIYDPVTWFQSYESYFDFTQLINQSINQSIGTWRQNWISSKHDKNTAVMYIQTGVQPGPNSVY